MNTFLFSPHTKESRRDEVTIALRKEGFVAFREDLTICTDATRAQVLVTAAEGLFLSFDKY